MRLSCHVFFVGSLLLLALGFGSRTVASEEGADKTLDVRIRLHMTWDDVGKLGNVNIWESGQASFVVGGRMKLKERNGDSLSYVPESLRATWRWRHVYRMSPKVRARDACPPGSVLSIETGNGSGSLDDDDLTLEVIVGKAAGMAAAAYGGSPDADGMYVLIVKKVIDTTVDHRQKDCFPAPYPNQTTNERLFTLIAQGTTKHGRIRGTHSWTQQKRVSLGVIGAQIVDLGPSPVRSGHVPGGNVQLDVSYRLGKPKMLEIQRRKHGTWTDVTYEEGDRPWVVRVGERMELRAVLQPEEQEAPDGRWTIPDPVVEDWVVKGKPEGYGTATVDPLEEAERHGGSVRFHWWGTSGEKTVAVRTSTGGSKRVEAHFRVEEPEIQIRTVVPSAARFTIATNPDGNRELVCFVEGEHTITFRHEPLPWTTPGETQYVQLVKTDARNEMGPSSRVGPCMELHVEGLDKTYPYAPGPSATDNPGVPATTYDLKLLVLYDFEMFLMYRPDTEGAIWVPLRIVPWTWNGQAQRETEGAAWDCTGSSITREPVDTKADRFPTWTRVVTEDLPWSSCSD